MELRMAVASYFKNRLRDLVAISYPKTIFVLIISVAASLSMTACGKSNHAADQPFAGMALPVTVIEVQPTSVPISAEAVAQTEGAKEVEIRPRIGGILIKRLYEEGAAVKAGQPIFLIDPVPYQYALAEAKAELSEQEARA